MQIPEASGVHKLIEAGDRRALFGLVIGGTDGHYFGVVTTWERDGSSLKPGPRYTLSNDEVERFLDAYSEIVQPSRRWETLS